MAEEITIHLTVTGDQGSPRVPLKIAKSISAAALLKSASETTKIPLGTLKLIFRGRLIASDEVKIAAEEYKLEEGSVLHCMGKPVKDEPLAAAAASVIPTAAPVAAARPGVPFAAAAAPLPGSNQPMAAAAVPSDPLVAALQAMRATNSAADYQTAVQVLDKLLSNIITHPLEDKYRRVKKENPAFQRRLGGIAGGEAVLLAAGFVSEKDESGADVFMMQASADAWPKLQATKSTVEQAVFQVNAARTIAAGPGIGAASSALGSLGAPFLPANGMGGFPGAGAMPPDMNQFERAMLSDPAMLQNIMQNPMFQNMMQNDPRIANNPMMQRAMQEMASNPQMLAQMSQLMQDPQAMQQVQAMMQDPQMRQQMQAMGMPPMGAGMPSLGSGGGGGMPNLMPPSAGAGAPSAGNPRQRQPGASDEDLTEEEMIAEAIRRSLYDSQPPS